MDGDGKVDRYMDFTHGADKFDFKAIDANVGLTGDQDFTFLGEAPFTTTPGQVRAVYDAANNVTHVQLNTDFDTAAEGWIEVVGEHSFTAADFFM
jgi:serralysin